MITSLSLPLSLPLAAAASRTSTGEAVQFWVLGTVAVLGALGTVLMKKSVHSALSLAGTMIVLAVFYLAEGAYFLGVVQIVVYTGAIMMLFLFVVMLVGITSADSLKETLKGQRFMAAICGIGFGVLLIAGIGNASLDSFAGVGAANAAHGGNVPGLAQLIFTNYVWAFEITGALLITAAVGAMVLTHRERTEERRSQRELSEGRVREGKQVTPLPAPGTYARHNAVDIPALLPDGSIAELSVSGTLRERGQIRDVSQDALRRLAELDQRSEEWLERPSLTGATRYDPDRAPDRAPDPDRDSARARPRARDGDGDVDGGRDGGAAGDSDRDRAEEGAK